MLLEDIAKVVEIVNTPSAILMDGETGDFIDKEDIGNFVVIYDSKAELWKSLEDKENDSKKKRKRKTSKKVVSDEDLPEAEEEDTISVSKETKLSIIARKLRINEINPLILGNNNWFICPIYNNMDSLRPVTPKQIKDGFVLLLEPEPLVNIDNTIFTKETLFSNELRWDYSPIPLLESYFISNQISRFQCMSVFRHKKNRYRSQELKALANQTVVFQKTRIKVGNNIINMVYNSMGKRKFREVKELELEKKLTKNSKKSSSASIEDKLKDVKTDDVKMLKDMILPDYKTIIELAKANGEEINGYETFKKYNKSPYIPNYSTFAIIKSYLHLCKIEEDITAEMTTLVRQHPMWQHWLVGIKGCAEVNAAYLLANFDVWNTEHPSAFIRYIGLDQVPVKPEDDNYSIESKIKAMKLLFRDITLIRERSARFDTLVSEESFSAFKTDSVYTFDEYEILLAIHKKYHNIFDGDVDPDDKNVLAALDEIEDDDEFVNIFRRNLEQFQVIDYNNEDNNHVTLIKKRARNKSDKEITTYISSTGELKTKYSLGYNSELKGRVVGVLFDCMIKARGGYAKIYNDYKNRLTNRPDIKEKIANGEKPKIHFMARRYTMQRFLEHFWKAYRQLEGLPLNGGTYAEGKLFLYHLNGNGPALMANGYTTKRDAKKDSMQF